MQIEPFFDEDSSTFSYIVLDTKSGQCAIIDSVLGYDPKSGRTSRAGADRIAERVRELGASVQWLLETHVHADHLSAAPYLQSLLGGRTGIGENIRTVQKAFGQLFNAEPEFARDGRQFDHLFDDGETFTVGTLQVQAMHTPSHTPACMTYVIEDSVAPDAPAAAFVGDTLFMPDYGTARCDFPGGRRLDVGWLLSPGKNQRLINVGSIVPLHEGGEVEQCSARFIQLESQAAPEVQIVVDGLPERVHCAPPGHGTASVRSASMSIFV
ncbi:MULTISPECIES: MBL fold metallo-hydrolase [Burkholderiaceae]|uniref:MBL fold metallo-hydrolase n=1 Tax=Burkholderiaceae TaxID=119060 RepID=UPI0003C7468C|nr:MULTISPECIES: MBL fold metallo-hydrolase [Burkholderiaceae]MCA8347442.1 MBL fold metallo-hydrolase [Burkholderia cepacia]